MQTDQDLESIAGTVPIALGGHVLQTVLNHHHRNALIRRLTLASVHDVQNAAWVACFRLVSSLQWAVVRNWDRVQGHSPVEALATAQLAEAPVNAIQLQHLGTEEVLKLVVQIHHYLLIEK